MHPSTVVGRFLILHIACIAMWGVPRRAGYGSPPDRSARRNILLVCVDDLRPELGCYGVEYIESPNLDRLASQSRVFDHHYVQAPTCGASRCALLTGKYGGGDNGALFRRAVQLRQGKPVGASLPSWFRFHGYTTVAVGKVSHHPGGMGGPDWNDPSQLEMPDAWDRNLLPAGPWKHPRGWMHGLAHGEIRGDAKQMDVFQSIEGPDAIYPDGVMIPEALHQMELLAEDQRPFLLAVGILRPHLPFGAPARYMQPYRDAILPPIPHPGKPSWRTTWHGSGEFMKYNRWGRNPIVDTQFADQVRRHYAACVSFADAQVGKLLSRLSTLGLADNTIVVVWGDHGWHLGERAVWGKHTLFEESLRSPLMIRYPGMPRPGDHARAVVESIDVFPTLCALTGVPMPEGLQGGSLEQQLENPELRGGFAISYFGKARSVRDSRFRLVEHRDGYVELYDHMDRAEDANVADAHPEVVEALRSLLLQHHGTSW